jgi:hypothetical protein
VPALPNSGKENNIAGAFMLHMKGIFSMTLFSFLLSCTFMAVLFGISNYMLASPRVSGYANCQKIFPEQVLVIETHNERIPHCLYGRRERI